MTDRATYPVATKFGIIVLTPTSATHIYATTNPGSGRDDKKLDWVINGKTYHGNVTAHMHFRDGAWAIGEDAYSGLYFDAGTPAARKAARSELVRVVNEWTVTAADALHTAAILDVVTDIERVTRKRDEAQAELDKYNALLAKFDAMLVALGAKNAKKTKA